MCLFKDCYVYLLIRAFQCCSSVAVLICLCACCFIFCVPFVIICYMSLILLCVCVGGGGGGGGGNVFRESGISSVSSLGFGYCFLIMYNDHLLTKNAEEIFMVFHLPLGYDYPIFF